MKTSTAHKLQLIKASIRDGNMPQVGLRGSDLRYSVKSVRNLIHSVGLELGRNAGVLIVDPDEIQLVHVPVLPKRPDAEAD